ncbi:MAG: nucleotidyltransferase [Steroidobacteraceae bacterium]
MIELPDDFRDLLIELTDAGAEFVLVGGHAVAFHGHPRATKDMDVLIRANSSNAERVYRALAAFGAPLQNFDVQAKDFATYSGVLQIGLPPRRVDILNRADGISFDEAVAEGSAFTLEGRRIPVIGRAALIKNKQAAGRAQDTADLQVLAAQILPGDKPGGKP